MKAITKQKFEKKLYHLLTNYFPDNDALSLVHCFEESLVHCLKGVHSDIGYLPDESTIYSDFLESIKHTLEDVFKKS